MTDENNKTPPTEEGGQSELGDAMMTPKKKRGRPRKYEDLLERIRVLREKEHQSFWIIAATGAVSNPIIHPSPTLGYVQYQGSYDILNLSGSFIYDAMSPPNKLGELTIAGQELSMGFDRVPCPQTFPNVIASPNLPIIPTQPTIPTQVMPNHEGDQYEIRVPCPQTFPAFNNNQDETPVRYQQTSFFNLNHLP
ncbi:hypothetical protein ACLB2K_022199 [Fragaria x ananassa]